MGKGKKKKKANKGKRDGKKNREDTDVVLYASNLRAATPEQNERARLAAANRKEDPLKNWTRLQNEECPICMLPLSHGAPYSIYCVTCGKTVCAGCMISTGIAHGKDSGDEQTAIEKARTCPYCRSNTANNACKYVLEQEMKRANAGNGESMRRLGEYYYKGEMGLQQDKAEGLKWYHRALEAGDGTAAWMIGACYLHDDGVEQDHGKALEYIQKAAELGYIFAFQVVGMILMNKGDIEEAMLNYRKAVMCGMSDDSLFNVLRQGFKDAYITKDEYAFTLRENQAASNEMKSVIREEFKEFMNR